MASLPGFAGLWDEEEDGVRDQPCLSNPRDQPQGITTWYQVRRWLRGQDFNGFSCYLQRGLCF